MKMRSAGQWVMWSRERLKPSQGHAGRCADHLDAGAPEALVAFVPDLGGCCAVLCLSAVEAAPFPP